MGTVARYRDRGKSHKPDLCKSLETAVQAGQIRLEALARGQRPGRPLGRALPGLRTVGYWDASFPQNWGPGWHRNEGFELTYLHRGTLQFADSQHSVALVPGDVVVTRPWQLHCTGAPNITANRMYWLILDVGVRQAHDRWRWPSWILLSDRDLTQLTEKLQHADKLLWRATPDFVRTFCRIGEAIESNRDGSQISRIAIDINQLLLTLLDMSRCPDIPLNGELSTPKHSVELFWEHLLQNPENLTKQWTVQRMARHCDLGITRFIDYTKQITSVTPGQYLNNCRLTLAARLLKEQPDRSITEIALSCGFGSSQYFATLFRQRFGMRPKEARRPTVRS